MSRSFRTCGVVLVAAAFATTARAEPPPIPALFLICGLDPAVVLDVTVATFDEQQVAGVVNLVFVDEAQADDGGIATPAPGDEVVVPGSCGVSTPAGSRVLLLIDAAGACMDSFVLDENGVVALGRPDIVTSEEAGAAAVSDTCESDLREAGFDPPRQDETLERLFGCAATSSPAATFPFVLLLAAGAALSFRRRRGAIDVVNAAS